MPRSNSQTMGKGGAANFPTITAARIMFSRIFTKLATKFASLSCFRGRHVSHSAGSWPAIEPNAQNLIVTTAGRECFEIPQSSATSNVASPRSEKCHLSNVYCKGRVGQQGVTFFSFNAFSKLFGDSSGHKLVNKSPSIYLPFYLHLST